MKKSLVLSLGLALIGSPVFAAKWKSLKEPTGSHVSKVYKAIAAVKGSYHGAYKVVTPTEAHGRTPEQLHLAEIKEAMHRYMCGFFDESIGITRTSAVAEAERDLDVSNNIEDEKQAKALHDALPALLNDRSLEVYSGSASGNNTMGEVMGVYDTKNDEVTYLGFTNCGSDD